MKSGFSDILLIEPPKYSECIKFRICRCGCTCSLDDEDCECTLIDCDCPRKSFEDYINEISGVNDEIRF